MKTESLSIVAMRASRLLAGVALVVSLAALFALELRLPSNLMAPPAALCALLLALASLLVSAQQVWLRRCGQLLAVITCLLAVTPALANDLAPWLARAPIASLARMWPAVDPAATTRIVLAATALALAFMPSREALGRSLAAGSATVGLLVAATSLIGYALGSPLLAGLGLDANPMPQQVVNVVAGILLIATLAQRGDTGWLSVLLGPSAAGSSARGIIAWTVIGPLAFALLALAGERQGFYNMEFAFALLAAVMCCGLTALVLWNATRVERAQERAASARDAMQLAANRLRLAHSASGIEMWEWLPARREWLSLDGAERLDPSANEFLEVGLMRALRDGKAEFEFPMRRFTEREERWMLATCWRELRDPQPVVVGISVDITDRKRAALALEASETRLQLAARALPGFVYDWNCASGKILRTSGIELMLGYRGAEISPVSRWWEDLVHPDDRELALPRRVARAAGQDSEADSIACEYRVRHANGRYQWIWDHCVLVRDRSGQVTRVVGSVLDITERKEAAARLALSEQRFKAALMATTGIFWTFTPDGLARGEQTSWSAFTGQRPEALADMGWLAAIHPDDVTRTLEAWREALSTREDLVTVQRVRRHDGVYRTFAVHAVPVTDERGVLTEWVGSHTDITEQRAAEQHVHDIVRRLELALDASSVGMWDWDLDTGRMTWTRQMHLITDLPAEAFTGDAHQFFGMLMPASTDHAAAFMLEVTQPGAVKEAELELLRPDGTLRWLQHRATGIAEADGHIHRIIGTVRDVTRRRELESERESLLAAERAARNDLLAAAHAKDEFLATISHELRTPLNAILGWTTLLQRPRVDPTTMGDGLKVIERNARAQTQLLGDLLDANQMMSGKLSLNFEAMDFNEAVRATLDSMRVSVAARKVRLESQVPDTPLPVMGDSGRLQQVISNLLSNAIKFTPAGGLISVLTGATAEMAFCEVRDSGEGIAPEFLPQIFERFTQADSGSARRFAGLGLGLAITRQLVESHGGAISVHSEGRGKGAMFRVQVPRLKTIDVPAIDAPSLDSRGKPARAGRGTDKPLAGLRILAVDDEADSREYLQRLLAEQGADIVSVASAAEALDALGADSARFNLLVSDIGMPGSTGYDLIEAVRGRLKVDARNLPAVALTAFARREDSARALDKGFQRHLAKPVQVGRLIGAIRQLTGRQQARRAASAPSLR